MIFRQACLKLAGVYLSVIMACCLLTSLWIYQLGMRELRDGLSVSLDMRLQKMSPGEDRTRTKQSLQAKIDEGRRRIITQLVYFNAAAFVLGGPGSYLLARRMLRPIDSAMRTQNRFTSDASHELRTPLTAIKSQTELALLEGKYGKAIIKPLLESSLEEINRLTELSEGLLLLAHEKPAGHVKTIRLDEAILYVVGRLQPIARAKYIKVQSKLTPAAVVAPEQDIERLATILIDNAIKYSPPKTIVRVLLEVKNNQAILAITDQGYGISAADLPHIFDRFFRSDDARSHHIAPGHGLGLAIAQKIVNDLQGIIHVASTEGKGSTFTVQLPLKTPQFL